MIEKTLRWVALGAVFALPFIVLYISTSLFFPFITGKNFAFRILVEIATAAWLALALVNPIYRPRRSWLLAAFAIFVIIIGIADVFGVYPFKSIWSNFERMDGWVTLAHLLLYIVVAVSMLSTEKLWTRLFQTSLGVSILVGGYALLQLLGVASLNQGFSSLARLDATFGNPIYLAGYMLFHVFIAALLLAHMWDKGQGRRVLGIWIYGSLIVFDIIILFLTGTRGAILGLAGGVLLAASLFVLSSNAQYARRIAIGLVMFVLFAVGSIYLVRDQEWAKNAPVLGRLTTISISESTVQARIMNWGMAWEGFKERPLLGWGQENYAVVFSKYYNPQMYSAEQWFDRVHNVIFDWLVAGGILGLLAYLSLFAISILYLWRSKRGDTQAFTVFEACILTGLLAAYFFHNLFVFDNIMSYLLFATILAYIVFRRGEAADAPRVIESSFISMKALPIVAVCVVALLWASAWYVNARPIAANKALLKGLMNHPEGITKNLEYFKESLSYNTVGTQEVREQLMQAATRFASVEQVPLEIKRQFFVEAAEGLEQQSKDSPLDPRPVLFLGAMLNAFGLLNEANPILERAHALSPTKQTIIFERAANAFARGDTAASLALFKEAHELAPEYKEARSLYAAAAVRSGNLALADEILAEAILAGNAGDDRITAAYVAVGRYDKLLPIWRAQVEHHPKDVAAHVTLASVYYKLGNASSAIAQLEALKQEVPEAGEDADKLISDIRSGNVSF